MALLPQLLFLLTGTGFAEVQFSTYLNEDSDTPVFMKDTAFVLKCQAVTSESEGKGREFSLFPHLPEINLTVAYSLVANRAHTDTLAAMNTVKRCQTGASENAYELLFNRIDEQLTILERDYRSPRRSKPFSWNWNFVLPPQSTISVRFLT